PAGRRAFPYPLPQPRLRCGARSRGNRSGRGRMTTPVTSWITNLWHGMATRPWLAFVLAGLFVASVFGRDQLLAWRHRRHATGAQWVTIAAPPEVTPESAAQFWSTMVGVLTPSVWRRRLYGTPHVAWEYTWTGRVLNLRVWVPGTIPP